MADRHLIQQELLRLAEDPVAAEARSAVCSIVSGSLAAVGRLLRVRGSLFGQDRLTPFGFGDDATVGLATVAQIAAQLASGANSLLEAGNVYAASVLIRQIAEVEYLAFAFDEEHDVASEWLRADRQERLAFWTLAELRARAEGRFLASDYHHHGELGGHPTARGRQLLPDHSAMPTPNPVAGSVISRPRWTCWTLLADQQKFSPWDGGPCFHRAVERPYLAGTRSTVLSIEIRSSSSRLAR